MPIKDYSTTAANNTLTPPNGAPEGMAAGLVNNTIRQVMADTRSFYESGGWCDLGYVPTYVSATSFTIPTDVTAFYSVGRRIRLYGPIMGTFYGFITASVYSSPNTTVTVVLDSGTLTSNLSRVDLAFTEQEAQRLADNAVTTAKIADGNVTPIKLSTGYPYWDSSGRVGIGTNSPVNESKLTVTGNSISVTGSDGDFSAGGNRAFMDFTVSGEARFGSVNGGGSATSVLFVSNNFETARIDSSGNFGINSGYGSVGTIYGCRAWVNFNGTGTVAIRSSGNVSSITDHGVGDYTINLTNSMPDGNYSVLLTNQSNGAVVDLICIKDGFGPSAGNCRIFNAAATTGVGRDPLIVSAAIIR
jgi:hypothetical protein